ncbi:Ciliary rootlet component centrosome cohesion family protein [Acanthocheilonema viteae]
MSEQSSEDINVEIDKLFEIDETTLSDFAIHSDDALPSTSVTHNVRSPTDVVFVSSHLNSYRNRIDASVDEQRKYRQVLAGLSNKVKKYRKRTAKSVAQLAPDVDTIGGILSRPPEMLRVGPDGLSSNPLLPSSFADTGFKTKLPDSSTDMIIQQLRNEQIRNDSLEDLNDIYREQAKVAIRSNQSLKDELLKTKEELMKVTHEREMERCLLRQSDEKKKRAMDTQYQHMLELWVSFNRLRRQVRDLRTETESDLDRQRTEFIRCANNMEALVCQAEMKRKRVAFEKTKDEDAMNDLLKKYEDVAVRTIKLEHELNDSNRRVAFMDGLVKKANEERDAAKDSLKKIHLIPELDEIRGRRTRSVSPDDFLGYFNTIRLVRAALQDKNNEIKDYKRKCNEYQDKLSERENRLTRMEESRRKNDEEFVDLKKENDKIRRDKEEIERKFRRLNERFERLDTEKNETQKAIEQLQNEIHLLNINHQETLNEMFIKQQEEFAERRKYFEDELKERDTDNTQKLLFLKNELEKYKNEVDELRDQLRNAQADCEAERRRVAEKENIVLEHQLALRNLRDENSDIRIASDAKDIRIAELQRHTEDLKLEAKQKDETLDEIRNEKSVLATENTSLLANISALRANMTENKNILEQNEKALENATMKISEITKQLKDRDQKILLLEKAVIDYEIKVDSTNEQILNTKVEQAMRREELEQNAAKIISLNQEKTKLLKERSDLENELGRVSNAAVELEKKIIDLEKCIESHVAQETMLHDALEQYKVKEQEISQALAKSQFEIARLNEINDRIKSEHNAELKRVHHEYREIEKKVIIQKKTEIENYEDTIFALRENKEYLEKSLAGTEEKMKELSLRYENVTFEKENLRTHLDEEKEWYEKEINSLRQQLDAIKEQYVEEIAEWEKICTEKDSSYNLKVLKMEDDMKVLNDRLQRSEEAESNLRRKMVDLNLLIDREKDTVKLSQSEISNKEEEMKLELEKKLDQVRRKWDEKIKLKDDELVKARYNIETLQTKCLELEKTLHSVESRLDKKTKDLSTAENELKQMEDRIALRMNEEAAFKSILADNKREKKDLKIQRDELKVSLQGAYTRAEEMKSNEEILRKEIGMMKSKLQDEEKQAQKLSNDMKQLENENKKLEVILSERTSDLSSLTALLKQSESIQKQTIKELEEEKQKSYETGKKIAALQAENEKLSSDLTHTRSVLEQKITTNQQAMADIVKNYKAAEKSRIEAIHERESIADELNNLKDLLAAGDAKRVNIEKTLAESEMLRKELVKKVAHFENSARRALSFAKARNLSSFRSCASEMNAKIINRLGEGSLRRSSSASFSPHVYFDLNSDVESVSLESLDISSSVEITFRHLKDRINELEQAKANEAATLIRLKVDRERISKENQKNLDKIHLLERKIVDLEEDKRLLESRLSNSRQLLVSQEESLRAREVERKALKTRVVSTDLHSRDREARLSSLNKQVAALKIELATVEDERKKLEKFQVMWEEERLLYESACKDADKKVEQYRIDMKSVISAKEKLEERLNETQHLLARTQQQCEELEKANKEYKNMLEQAKVDKGLGEDRRKQDDHAKISDSDLLSKLNVLQHEYDNCLFRLRASDLGKQSLKNDLDEARNRQKQTSHRIASMQHKLEELLAEKNRLQERLGIMEKREKDNQQMEKDMRIELEKLRAEKIMLLAENEELKRRLNKAEVEHREFDAYRARLERERLALKRNIETLETEKQRTDAAIRQITSERQALDKSLTTMEKENMELYRNCTQLQNQVVQLEKENSSNLVKESAAQLRALENKLMQAQCERQQIEQLLEQRELACSQKIKLLESKIMVLKEQLDAERKRRLEVVERKAVVQRDLQELRLYRQIRRRKTIDSKN